MPDWDELDPDPLMGSLELNPSKIMCAPSSVHPRFSRSSTTREEDTDTTATSNKWRASQVAFLVVPQLARILGWRFEQESKALSVSDRDAVPMIPRSKTGIGLDEENGRTSQAPVHLPGDFVVNSNRILQRIPSPTAGKAGATVLDPLFESRLGDSNLPAQPDRREESQSDQFIDSRFGGVEDLSNRFSSEEFHGDLRHPI
jgi:hypothetical protein